MNKKLLTAVVGATLAVAGSAANAFEAKLSGHLHRGVMVADDGGNSEIYHVDGTTSGSRIRFLASEEIMPGITAGVNWENGFNSNPGGTVSQTARTVAASLSERHQEIYFRGSFGRIGFGQGEGAAYDTISVDLSGTGLAAGGAPADWGGGLFFRTTAGPLSAVTFGTVMNNYNASASGGRYDRVRYDSPALGPVTLHASTGYTAENDANEFAVRFSTDLPGGSKLAAQLGFSKVTPVSGSATRDEETVDASISWLAPFGLNVTVAHATRENETAAGAANLDGKFTRLKLGYLSGQHAVSVHYATGEDQVLTGDESKEIGVEYAFKPKPWADLYAAYKTLSLDRTGVSYEDMQVLLVGSRLVF